MKKKINFKKKRKKKEMIGRNYVVWKNYVV